MLNDRVTLKDLSIFSYDLGEDVFGLLDHTVTQAGKDTLRRHIMNPPDSYIQLKMMQDTVRFLAGHPEVWTDKISNGTLVMLDKFFDTADNTITPPSGLSMMLGSFFQKLLNRNQYFFTQFSLSHLADFLKGCLQLAEMLDKHKLPELLQKELQAMKEELNHRLTADVVGIKKDTQYSELIRLNYNVRREMKNTVLRLITHYARLDAWQSMAKAGVKNKWCLPELLPARPLCFEAESLYHPLLSSPVPYNIAFNNSRNFLLLTGANMSGKTTFMRALGVGALLAHLGMAVPAARLRISFMQGVITNMHVEDNILKGESYFFAEVQRMKMTAEKLLQSEPHMVLMDELFKGTNVHDAYECTRAVVEGLLHKPDHLMILSTHLYEVAQHFRDKPEVQFAYFVTNMSDNGSYHFTYELKEGISNDRIGYRILQKEGVIDLLKSNRHK